MQFPHSPSRDKNSCLRVPLHFPLTSIGWDEVECLEELTSSALRGMLITISKQQQDVLHFLQLLQEGALHVPSN